LLVKKWDGVGSPSTYLFHVFCFFVGFAVLAVFTLGRVKVDYSDGPSWNPCSRLPDGKPALSEDCVSTLGFAAMAVPLLLLLWHIG
jgi:hypothetical protein